MAETTANNDSYSPWWVKLIQTFGITTVACIFLLRWANDTIGWERDKFLPALESNRAVMEKTIASTEESTQVSREVKESLDRLNKTTANAQREVERTNGAN